MVESASGLAPRGDRAAARVVVLGASNATRGLATLLATARQAIGEPFDALTAIGHGRSFGLRSTVLVRQLPPIVGCGLWSQLERSSAERTWALVTDIGNDLLYEVPVGRIVDWVVWCLDRLAAVDARTVITSLPLEHLPQLSEARFRLFRGLFHPFCRLSLGETLRRAEQLDTLLAELARQRGVQRVSWRGADFGFDPIHVRQHLWPEVWPRVLASWFGDTAPARVSASWHDWWRTRWLAPQERWMFGYRQHRDQPCARLGNQARLYVY